jgi:hypothetical protein
MELVDGKLLCELPGSILSCLEISLTNVKSIFNNLAAMTKNGVQLNPIPAMRIPLCRSFVAAGVEMLSLV